MSAEEDYEHLSALADRLELNDEDRAYFIESGMRRLGYKPRYVWEDREVTEGDFFSVRRRRQSKPR